MTDQILLSFECRLHLSFGRQREKCVRARTAHNICYLDDDVYFSSGGDCD